MTGIIFIIIIGLILLIVEFLLIPGITIAGIGGFILITTGIVWAYTGYGNTIGHITLASTVFASILFIALSLRAKTWRRFTLATNMNSNVETNVTKELIKPGDTGISISRLAPMGKVRINDLVVEAKSTGDYINEKTEIEVIRIEGPNVIVKLKN